MEASQSLPLMSKGHYHLISKEDRASSSGLEFEVKDAYTFKVRPVVTLSVGESFMMTLYIAL